MASTQKSARSNNSRRSRLSKWAPVITSLALFIPAGFHYHNNEIFAAACLFMSGILRAKYKVSPRSTNVSNTTLSLMHDMLFIVSCILVHLNTLYLGVQYRPDITYTIVLGLALCKSVILLLDISSDKSFILWNGYIVLLLCMNIVLPNVGYPLSLASFGKGFFWGGALYHCVFIGPTLRAYITHRLAPYALFARMQMAPFTTISRPSPRSHLDKAYHDELD